MGILKRTQTLFQAKANAALDKAEDPRQTLDLSYEQQLENLTKVKRAVADVATAKKRIEIQAEQLKAQGDKLAEQAKAALGQGNEDLAREYQAIIAYVVYSQVLKGAEFMNIADQLETHAQQELQHALIISRQIDYLGKMPTVNPKPVKVSEDSKQMLRFDLDNENETIRNYRERIRQCEAMGEFALAEQIRKIVIQEQDHQIDLATALGIEVPNIGGV